MEVGREDGSKASGFWVCQSSPYWKSMTALQGIRYSVTAQALIILSNDTLEDEGLT